MIAFAFLLLQTPAVPQSAPEADVVVIGKRLAAWRGRVLTTIGITTCKTTIFTGDKEVDDVGCMAFKQCWSTYRPELASARKQRRHEESDDVHAVEAALSQCLKSTRDQLVDQLAARRRVRPS